ncbi:YggS family pyridoxal phosphate-dependent enzyme [Varibaculum vaginae]|uniref:YggS family pyridoxal phosphate-dependent enzyme n=1 Tax=Varibaculum vaginae TaxID=2364797 RepID=UPI000F078D05|nr:YggS family pyridoxal phosphate-dependent enzyme [Varibaculum vaginae]
MDIATGIEQVDQRITKACEQAGRRRSEVTLELAVKTRTSEQIITASQEMKKRGLPAVLGHNHIQEAQATNEAVRAANPDAEVHIIGRLQGNKITAALKVCDLVETVDSLKTAQRLERRLVANYPGRILPCFIEVNCSREASKEGISPEAAWDLTQQVLEMEHLSLRGFMTIGALSPDEKRIHESFQILRELRDRTVSTGGRAQDATQLSMGMSGDLEIAISEGATIVRIGTDIFGSRDYR